MYRRDYMTLREILDRQALYKEAGGIKAFTGFVGNLIGGKKIRELKSLVKKHESAVKNLNKWKAEYEKLQASGKASEEEIARVQRQLKRAQTRVNNIQGQMQTIQSSGRYRLATGIQQKGERAEQKLSDWFFGKKEPAPGEQGVTNATNEAAKGMKMENTPKPGGTPKQQELPGMPNKPEQGDWEKVKQYVKEHPYRSTAAGLLLGGGLGEGIRAGLNWFRRSSSPFGSLEHSIAKNPLLGAGIAAGGGLMLGSMMNKNSEYPYTLRKNAWARGLRITKYGLKRLPIRDFGTQVTWFTEKYPRETLAALTALGLGGMYTLSHRRH